MMFVGYHPLNFSYRFLRPDGSSRIMESRNATFVEDDFSAAKEVMEAFEGTEFEPPDLSDPWGRSTFTVETELVKLISRQDASFGPSSIPARPQTPSPQHELTPADEVSDESVPLLPPLSPVSMPDERELQPSQQAQPERGTFRRKEQQLPSYPLRKGTRERQGVSRYGMIDYTKDLGQGHYTLAIGRRESPQKVIHRHIKNIEDGLTRYTFGGAISAPSSEEIERASIPALIPPHAMPHKRMGVIPAGARKTKRVDEVRI
jgi:hypothetical protein